MYQRSMGEVRVRTESHSPLLPLYILTTLDFRHFSVISSVTSELKGHSYKLALVFGIRVYAQQVSVFFLKSYSCCSNCL